MEPVCNQVDYESIDAPKHFVDFHNLSNFEDDQADKWFDNHTEDVFEDAFLPHLETPNLKTSVVIKTEPLLTNKHTSSTVKVEGGTLNAPLHVRDELHQVERLDEPKDRETFLISKTPVKGLKLGAYSPRPQPIPPVKKQVAPPTLNTGPVTIKKEDGSPVLTKKSSRESPSKDVPIIKQTSFKPYVSQRAAALKAISCIHSLLSPRTKGPTPPRKTIPRTKGPTPPSKTTPRTKGPTPPSKTTPRTKGPTPPSKTTPRTGEKAPSSSESVKDKKPPSAKKTHEQLQMEEVKRLQGQTRQRLKASRRSFARLSKTSGPVQVKGKLPTTETVEFHFHQTTREKKGMVVRGDEAGGVAPQQFVKSLRSSRSADNFNPNMTQSSSTRLPTPPGGTIVKPFKFHLNQRKLGHRSTDPQASDEPVVPAAEFMFKYQKATPPRFRRTLKRPLLQDSFQPTLTIPRTPNLSTKTRTRPVTAKSSADLEEEEMQEIKQHEFKANPINAAVFDMGGLMGVPRMIPRRSLVPPATPELATKKRCLERKEREDTVDVSTVAFTANPMPDFSKVTGLPPKKELPVTNPESPAVTLKRRRLHDDEEEDGNDETKKPRTEETGFQFKANPVPDFSRTFTPQHEDRVPTLTEPFSFEERDKDKPTRESFVEMILRKSRPAPFKAQTLPDFSGGPTVPAKKELLPTKLQPFHLQSVIRANKHASDWKEKLDREETEAKAATVFKASEATVLYEIPFMPHQSDKPVTNPDEFILNTEVRSTQRAAFVEKLQKETKRKEEDNLIRRALHEIQEKKEITDYRKSLVHKAQPIKQYSMVKVTHSDKLPTKPISPIFHLDKRVRS